MSDDEREVRWIGLCDQCGTLFFDVTKKDPTWQWCPGRENTTAGRCVGWAHRLPNHEAALASFRLGGPEAVREMVMEKILTITAKRWRETVLYKMLPKKP